MKNSLRTISIIVVAITLFGYGCKKEKDQTDYDTESSKDNAQAESVMNEINEIADQGVEDGVLSTHRLANSDPDSYRDDLLSECANITMNIDSVDSSGTVTIDFGSHFCKGHDTKYRKGLITVSFTGPYRSVGTVITITATNYFEGYDSTNATKVNGVRTVTNNGVNGNGHLNYSIQANATLVNYLNEQFTWSSTRNREWIVGDSTSAWNDDEYLITGSASGTSYAGVNFTATITKALHVTLDYPCIIEGTFSLTPETKTARVLDYGNGTNDCDATVTINGKVYEITLR